MNFCSNNYEFSLTLVVSVITTIYPLGLLFRLPFELLPSEDSSELLFELSLELPLELLLGLLSSEELFDLLLCKVTS